MADPNLEELPNYRGDEFAVIRKGLRLGYGENDDQVIERLIAAWQADRATRSAAWNERREAEEAEMERRLQLEERARTEAEKKKPKMNAFASGLSVPDVLSLPPSQYALQKLNSFDYVELWYFSLSGRLDAANKSQADDTFGISKSIASVRASENALPDHELSFSDFLKAKNCFLEFAKKANWPSVNLDAVAKFFWFLETHPLLQLPLGEKTILTYAARVRQDWHRVLKVERGYDISIINSRLMSYISDEVRAFEDQQVKSQRRVIPQSTALQRHAPLGVR
ncbi:hypothetical protein EV363DRAFT_1404015 [Boletus edulis]|nr:hypothetical protein EV363DRAFT_1404015 [Boletus edulis]